MRSVKSARRHRRRESRRVLKGGEKGSFQPGEDLPDGQLISCQSTGYTEGEKRDEISENRILPLGAAGPDCHAAVLQPPGGGEEGNRDWRGALALRAAGHFGDGSL